MDTFERRSVGSPFIHEQFNEGFMHVMKTEIMLLYTELELQINYVGL